MASPSTPENVQKALDQIAAGQERAAKAPLEELLRVRRETVIIKGLRYYKRMMVAMMDRIHESERPVSDMESFSESALSFAHLYDVYDLANKAIESGTLPQQVESFRRQLFNSARRVEQRASAFQMISRSYYIAARTQFLAEYDDPKAFEEERV